MVTITYKGDGIPLRYGPDGKRADINNETYMQKFNRITQEVEEKRKEWNISDFNKKCDISLLVLAANCELGEALNPKHYKILVEECKRQTYFYNWAFCHSRKILNEGNINIDDGDFGRPGYLAKSNRYYELYIHLTEFDGDYHDLYNHLMCMLGPQKRADGDYYKGGY